MESTGLEQWQDWPAPPLGEHWKLGQLKNKQNYVLVGGSTQLLLSANEGQMLRYFNGKTTLGAIARRIDPKGETPNLVPDLLQKLIAHRVLGLGDVEPEDISPDVEVESARSPARPAASGMPQLKDGVEWRHNPDGHWILRNPINKTYMQASDAHKTVFSQLGRKNPAALLRETGLSKEEFQGFLQQLAATGMLEGTEPQKPPRGKFNPMQLLFFKTPLINPDAWLGRFAPALAWIWTRPFFLGLCFFLGCSLVWGLADRGKIFLQIQGLMANGAGFLVPFGLVTVSVVTLHELGHAFTLKHYRGIVPEIGLLWMCLFPAAYTDTSDSYCLSRKQRVWVVAAGLIVQIAIAAIAFWVWRLAGPGTWLQTLSLMAMFAGLVTVVLNLNPLARFDGYYLAVAATGINNLRSRAFMLYACWLQGQRSSEDPRDIPFLAFYAPFSLLYIWFVFGFLFLRLLSWTLLNARMTVLTLLVIWLIYYFWPAPEN